MASSISSGYHIDQILVTFINNGVFGKLDDREQLPAGGRYRRGTTKDGINVTNAINHIVKGKEDYIYKENLTAEGIKEHFAWIRERIDQSPKKYDGLMVIVSSHGGKDVILGSDELRVSIYEDIIAPFHNNQYKGLRGKIKIFVSNACRGDEGRTVQVYDSGTMVTDPLNVKKEVSKGINVHAKGDYVIIHSTAPDAVSVRDPEMGSPLLRHLFGEIEDVAESNCLSEMSVMDIFQNMKARYTKQDKGSVPGIEDYTEQKIYLSSKGIFIVFQ